jgi:6-phosphofructokinase 2
VLVSLGSQGALLVTAGEAHRFAHVDVPPGSGVGAGDAMVAGVAVGLTRGWPLTEAVRLGVAAGAAMLLTPGSTPCTREDAERLFAQTAPPVAVG